MNKKISDFLSGYPENGIFTIKLKDLLSIRDDDAYLREITTLFPPADIGSITLVDQITLLCLDEIVRPDSIVEIGTFQGFTTRLFLKNSEAKLVTSIDLPKICSGDKSEFDKTRVLSDGDYNDDYLREVQNDSGEIYLKDLSEKNFHRLRLVKFDSLKLDFLGFIGNADFGFIDGGHSYKHVSSDTENLRKIIRKGVIVWHDYSSSIHSDVSNYLNDISVSRRIFWVSGGLCAFEIIGY